jgi:hypothetical protein
MHLDQSDLIGGEHELAVLCAAQGVARGPLSAIPAPSSGAAVLFPADGEPGLALGDELLWALKVLADPARCLEVQTSLGDEFVRRTLLAWSSDGRPRMAVMEGSGREARVGLRSIAHVRAAIGKAVACEAPATTLRRALSAKAALALIATADHLRLQRLKSMIEETPLTRQFRAADVAARFARSASADFRWPLGFVARLWPEPLAAHEAARDVVGALAELDAAGLVARTGEGAEALYESVGQGALLAEALARDDVKVGLTVRRAPPAAGCPIDVAVLIRSRQHLALVHVVGADAAVRLIDATELDEWLARVIVLSPQAAARPAPAAGGSEDTVEIGSIQTLVMSLPPTVLKLELSDPTEGRRPLTLVGEGTLGRQAGNKIVVSEPGVSRIHARLYRDDGGLWQVTDLDTANGTFVNEQRIDKPTPIGPGDVIRVSQTTLRVVAVEE